MEVERERKEKLAAARKKLNEYKLNRGGAKSPAVSSKPADVPLFYQNLNAPATTFNLFNPAASVANNNVVAPASSYFSQPSASPTVFTPAGNSADSSSEANQSFLINQGQSPFVPQQQVEASHIPEVVNPPPVQPTGQQFGEERPLFYAPPAQSSSPGFVPLPTTAEFLSSPGAESEASSAQHEQSEGKGSTTPSFDNAPLLESGKPLELGEASLQDMNLGFGANEYFPSAPPLDQRASPIINKDNVEEQGADVVVDAPSMIENAGEARVRQESESTDLNTSNVQLFASSLFGSTGANDLDKIFNVSESIQAQAPLTEGELLQPETMRFNHHHEESSPPKNSLFSPVNEPEEDIIMSLQTFNDVALVTPSSSSAEMFPTDTSSFRTTSELVTGDGIIDNNEINLNNEASDWNDIDSSFSVKTEPLLVETSVPPLKEDNSPDLLPVITSYPDESNLNQLMDASFEPVHAKDTTTDDVVCHMKSMQEAMELQIEELRRENEYLLGRQNELTSRIEESEKLAHDFKVDRDRIKEESMTTSQALRARINSLCEENQRIVKNSTDVGVDLRAMMEEKTKQLEEMQKAVIIVSQSKMDFAARLDNELERVKELQNTIRTKDEEISSLRGTNAELQDKLKQELQKDAVIHQLQDQARHYQVQTETLQKELSILRRKLKEQDSETTQQGLQLSPTTGPHSHNYQYTEGAQYRDQFNPEKSDEVRTHSSCSQNHDHSNDHAPSVHQHDANVEVHHHSGTSEPHDHDHHHHDHNDHHHHDHSNHHHEHAHHHEDNVEVVARKGPSDEVTELKKTLHRLHWENSTFRNDIDILAVDAKQKHTYEEKCTALEEENTRLKKEVEHLEHLIIQLQGENDTIGDYITLYQTQKMALKECAKEKDAQLELLAREREMLLHRLAELTALVKDLRESKSEVGSQCADDHMHSLESAFPLAPTGNNKRQIEGKIRDLLSEISSSTLIENFHPCALCSGRLMTV